MLDDEQAYLGVIASIAKNLLVVKNNLEYALEKSPELDKDSAFSISESIARVTSMQNQANRALEKQTKPI